MFHSIQKLSLTFFLLALTTASPTPQSSDDAIVKLPGQCPANVGLPGAFYICTGTNFTGRCEWINPKNTCFVWPGGAAGRSGSIGPDYGGICDLYEDEHCGGKVVRTLECPGMTDAGDKEWYGSMKCRVNFDLG